MKNSYLIILAFVGTFVSCKKSANNNTSPQYKPLTEAVYASGRTDK